MTRTALTLLAGISTGLVIPFMWATPGQRTPPPACVAELERIQGEIRALKSAPGVDRADQGVQAVR